MRWRDRSSWWGFHPFLSQPISCRNGLCFDRHPRFFALKCRFCRGRWPQLSRGDRESQAAVDDRGYNSLSTLGIAHETLIPILIDSPLAPEEFLKQFTALLREHAAVDITAMI